MYNVILDNNNFYTGIYCSIGYYSTGVYTKTLPPDKDALCYKYIGSEDSETEWEFHEERLSQIKELEEHRKLEIEKENLLIQVSNKYSNKILEGPDIYLSDNKYHHFSMSILDQLNLYSLNNKLNIGSEEEILYHADGEQYKLYSLDDARSIYNGCENFKNMLLEECNRILCEIRACTSLDELHNITF